MKIAKPYTEVERSRMVNDYWERMAAECPRDGSPMRIGHYYSDTCTTWVAANCHDCGESFRVPETFLAGGTIRKKRRPIETPTNILEALLEFLRNPPPVSQAAISYVSSAIK